MGNKHQQLKLHQSFIFNPKHYRLFALGLFSFLCAYIVASTFTPVKNSDAAQEIHVENTQTGYYLTITIPDDVVNLNVDSTPGGQLASAATSVNVKTNSPNGYKLYLSTASSTDNNMYKDGDASNVDTGYYFSPAPGTPETPAKLGQNNWGFTLTAQDTPVPADNPVWSAVPLLNNQTQLAETSSANLPDGTNYPIYYGIKANISLPTGSYSTTVTYTALSEGVNLPTMQSFTSAECAALSDNQSIYLNDSRDGKLYRITKMLDGHCWMNQNLALDGVDEYGNLRTLTPNDSNVTSNHTFPEGVDIENGTTSEYDIAQIYTGNATSTTTNCGSYPDCIVSSEPYGNLYNWNAATATVGKQSTTGTVTESICPKGWRLPDDTGDFSYANLMGKYGLPTTGTSNHSAVQTAQKTPLNFPVAGDYISSSINQTRFGFYQSRTVSPSDTDRVSVFLINAELGQFGPRYEGPSSKLFGFSVRCVFGGQADEIMQNFTAAQCTNLAESTATADNRKTMIDSRDGKFYTISKLADGNCWMTSNLALDGMDGLGTVRTLTPSDSNVTTNRPLATNITNGTSGAYDAVQIYAGKSDLTTTSCGSYPYCVVSDVKYGNLYNWNAATAGVGKQATTGTVTESVCPNGWQIPNNTGGKSFNSLMSAYHLPTTNVTGDGTAVQSLQKVPLYFSLTGYYTTYRAWTGINAYYWSRTVTSSANYAYSVLIGSENGDFQPQRDNALKWYGLAVRCVFGS